MPGATLLITVITLNENEATAVRTMFGELERGGWRVAPESDRSLITRDHPVSGQRLHLRHVARGAQGNVIVAAELARAFVGADDATRPDYLVFFGCAGAVNSSDLGGHFLIAETRYLALGKVTADKKGTETFALKNKWIETNIHPREVKPLPAVSFPLIAGSGSLNLAKMTSFPAARVLATEAVVTVQPGTPPPKGTPGQPWDWPDGHWSFAQAMAHVQAHSAGMPLLVEMESYGIGMMTEILGLGDSVVVLRIATDDLVGKNKKPPPGTPPPPTQREYLLRGRLQLLQLLAVLYGLR